MIRLNFRRGSAFANKKAREWLKDKHPEDIRNVAVIRHAAIGDFMNIRPFLIELKEFFPNAKITLSVNKSAMYGMPEDLIDEVHIVQKDHPHKKGKKTSLFQRIQEAKTLPPQDIIFDLTDSSLTLLVVFFSKASLKIGYPYRWIRRLFYDIATLRSDFVLEAESVLHMLNILGAKTTRPLRYGYENKYPKNLKKRIIYFAGASIKEKCWEEEKFQKLIHKMSQSYQNYEHVILQGIKEDEKFLEIYEPLKKKDNVVLKSAMKLDETMQYLCNSSLVVSNDTGIRNMAIAVETPTVGIFFLTGAFRYWPRDGKHECVFRYDYKSPEIDEVYQVTLKHMEKLYEN